MASRLLQGGPEANTDAPSFTCEVCKISVRSAQKLLDHVNFSPLHKAALEGGGGGLHSPTKGRSGLRRVLYDGTKLFWRINETLELCIHEDTGANYITITASPQEQQHDQPEVKILPLLLDRRSVIRAATDDSKHQSGAVSSDTSMKTQSHRHSVVPSHALSPEVMCKFLLARLHAKRSGSTISLFLQKLKEDEMEPVVISNSHQLLMPTADVTTRRRHTYDEVKTAQKEVNEAAVELKKARVQAETLSNLARVTLEAFSKRPSPTMSVRPPHDGSGHKSEWLRVYDRVQFKAAVEHSKDVLGHHSSTNTKK